MNINILNSIVSISRFNKGEANKIFEEVNETGLKIVVKNNKPTCVLITPEVYQDMIEQIEDFKLYIEAERRMKKATEDDYIDENEILKQFGITEGQIEKFNDVEIE